jgi:integrase-like protein
MADETILIIDDSADTRLLLSLRLKAQGYGPSLRAMPWRTITLLEQKNGGRDTLPVNATTLDVLKARANVRSRTTDYVFSNGAGNRRDARDLLRVFYPAMKKADVRRFRFHDLRHSFATRLVHAGADIYTVQKLGRWKTISMVMRYAHHHSESLRAGIEILDRVPAESSTKLAQSAHVAVAEADARPLQVIERTERSGGCGGRI